METTALRLHPSRIARPAGDRIAEAPRLYAWPFLSWCFAAGRLIPDLDLLAGKGKDHHYVHLGGVPRRRRRLGRGGLH